jgi:hypothetical protein
MNIRGNRMGNCLSKPCELKNENLTRALQRYAVLGYERKQKDFLYIINNKV